MNYLRLPLGGGTNSKAIWRPVVEKFEKHLTRWKVKNLNMGSRLMLLKLVLSSLPTFFMSIFSIPVSIVNELDHIQRRFLWGRTNLN
ncbi:hypothetical protein PTKIN_Ptkin08bG0078100 [Pterospermum kingtungense]